MQNRFFLYILALALAACNSLSNHEIEGQWILNSMLYKGEEINPQSYTSKLTMNPVPYANKEIMTFHGQSKTGNFPGIQSHDVRIKWGIEGDSITIAVDSLFLEETILKPIEYLKVDALLNQSNSKQQMYDNQRDSIITKLGFSAFSKTLDVYTGKYKMEKYDNKLVLISKTTVMELVDLNKAYDASIDKALHNR